MRKMTLILCDRDASMRKKIENIVFAHRLSNSHFQSPSGGESFPSLKSFFFYSTASRVELISVITYLISTVKYATNYRKQTIIKPHATTFILCILLQFSAKYKRGRNVRNNLSMYIFDWYRSEKRSIYIYLQQ